MTAGTSALGWEGSLAPGQSGRVGGVWAVDVFLGAVMISRRAPYRPPLWPIEAPSVSRSFHELFGRWPDIPSFFDPLVLPEPCFGTGSGLIRSSCQFRLLFGEPADGLEAIINSTWLPILYMLILMNFNPVGLALDNECRRASA